MADSKRASSASSNQRSSIVPSSISHMASVIPQAPKSANTQLPIRDTPKTSRAMGTVRRMRRIISEDPEWTLTNVPYLTELCIKHIVQNFQSNPILTELLPEYQKKVLSSLPPDLPISITANLIDDESYWQRCCMQRWKVCHVERHGGSWKHMFFERHLENLLTHFIPGTTEPAVILDLLPFCKDYVRRLRVDQFLPPVQLPRHSKDGEQSDSGSEGDMEDSITDHYCLGPLVAGLKHLEELDLVFGVKDCGMNFEWNLFLFTYRDCHSLAATIKACHTLKIFRLTRSKVDDDKSRILIRSLLDHPALEELDLSHNLIGDRGARAAAKLMSHSRLRVLNLANNQVRTSGAQALAYALAHNNTLTSLNLRLNYIEDEGGQALVHALETNKCLTTLHLGSNELSESTATLLSQVLPTNTTLTSLSLACNNIGPDGGKQLLEGMSENRTLLEFDLRLSEIAQESEYLIGQALATNREMARQRDLNPSLFMSPIIAKGSGNPVG